jgi:hypothetical protein
MPTLKSPIKNQCINELNTGRNSDVTDYAPWLTNLYLDLNDKKILEDQQWLTDKHINATMTILKRQFPNIHGLQDTKLAPFFLDNKKIWNVDRKFARQIEYPSVQIHFDGSCHWTVSMKSIDDLNFIYYLDSLGENLKLLKNNIQIQLSQLYSSEKNNLCVKVPRVQQQPNSNDCGLFAIAQTVDFCYSGGRFNFKHQYIVSEMREHLFHCFVNEKMSPFPKENSKFQRPASFQGIHRSFKIKTTCMCEMPEFVDNMIQCDNRKCRKWFHQKCVGVKHKPKSLEKQFPWECFYCHNIN